MDNEETDVKLTINLESDYNRKDAGLILGDSSVPYSILGSKFIPTNGQGLLFS